MTKFDNTKHNIVILTDLVSEFFLEKTVGPYKVAHELRQAGYEVSVLHHLHTFSLEEIEHVLTHLISDKTLFVGVNNVFYSHADAPAKTRNIGAVVPQTDGAILPQGKQYNQRIKGLIKKLNPSVKLVLGGANAAKEAVNRDFDYLVPGYADRSIINLANHLCFGEPLNHSRKSVFGPIFINDTKAEGFDFVASTLRYRDCDAVLPRETLVIEVARGCVFNCAFCSYPLNGKKKLDFIKHEQVLTEEFIYNFEKFGVTRYLFSDDTFNDSVEKCQMINRISKQLPFTLEWWAFLRLDLIVAKPFTMDLLVESGLRGAFFGIETMNKQAASIIGKSGDRQRLIQTLRSIKNKWGDSISLHGNFILGLPKESVESMQETIRYLISDDNPLDSWACSALRLDSNSAFLSDIEKAPEKYGYTVDSTGHWVSDITNKSEMLALQMACSAVSKKQKLMSMYSFFCANDTFSLDDTLNKNMDELLQSGIIADKKRRVAQYKKMYFTANNIPDLELA